MEAFRTLIKGWLGKGLLVLFLTPLALAGMESWFSGTSTNVAAQVNNEKVTREELDGFIKSQRDRYLQQVKGDESVLNEAFIEKEAYDALVLRTILLQQAESLGLKLSDEQVGALLRQEAAFQRDGKFSQEAFEQYMAGTRTSMSALLDNVRKQTSLSLLVNSLTNTALYSEKSRDGLINLLAQERTVHLAELPLAQFAQNFVATDAQIKAYYEQHQKTLIRAENVDIAYVVLNKASFAEQAQVNEKDIEAKYQAFVKEQTKEATREVSHILIDGAMHSEADALKLANQINQELKQGKSFEALVAQYSEDDVSKALKGKLEGYSVGIFGDTFDQAVLGLTDGQVSAPVKTEAGYHLIRLDKSVAAEALPLSAVREQLIAELKATYSENAYQDAINQANELALETDALDSVAAQYKLQVQTAKGILRNTQNAVLADPAVKVKVFSEDVRQGNHHASTGITLQSGDTVWFKVLAHREQRTQTLDEAKAKIQASLKHEQQVKEANAQVADLVKALQTKPATEALASSQLKFNALGPVPRQSGLLPQALESAIYRVPAPKAGYWSATTEAIQDRLYVIGVSEIGKKSTI